MLAVKVSPRRTYYVELSPDTAPNKGGYFCEIFEDEEMEFKKDEFTLHNYELRGFEDRLKQAKKMADEKVKSMYAKK